MLTWLTFKTEKCNAPYLKKTTFWPSDEPTAAHCKHINISYLWGGSKRVISFPWIFYAMQTFGHFRNISRHLFTWLVCRSFPSRSGSVFTDCIVWDGKDKVTGFKRSHFIHLGWWSTRSPKLQLFPLSQHSHITTVDCYLLQLTFHEIWH